MKPVDIYKSIRELEGRRRGKTEPDVSGFSRLVQECTRLDGVPLREFTAGNLRMMIGQRIGLPFLVPLALARLQADPLTEADFYPGDLLVNVLGVSAPFWHSHPAWREQVTAAAKHAIAMFPTVPEIADDVVMKAVNEAYESFRRRLEPA